MLEFKQVFQQYQFRTLFADFSLALDEQRVLVSGANGTGKTTLLMMAAGLLQPDAGQVLLEGTNVLDDSMRSQIGISASKIALPGFLSVQQLLAFHCQQFGCELNQEWYQALGLAQYAATEVSNLSLGNMKKLSLLTAMLHQPRLLLLDEPTNGLDEQAKLALFSILSDYSGQLVIASHEPLPDEQLEYRHIALQRPQENA